MEKAGTYATGAEQALGAALGTGAEVVATVPIQRALRSREAANLNAAQESAAALDVNTAPSTMIAEATRGTEQSLKELGAAMHQSNAYVGLQNRELFDLLEQRTSVCRSAEPRALRPAGAEDEFLSQEEELRAEVATMEMLAASEAGDRSSTSKRRCRCRGGGSSSTCTTSATRSRA